MGCIYKITNMINNKIYIGLTTVTEPRRWQQHVWHAVKQTGNDSPLLCNAIAKYGKENFIREIIYTTDDIDILRQKEIEYIQKYNSTNHEIGYNLSNGGEGNSKYSSEIIRELYSQYGNLTKVAAVLGASRDIISKRLQDMGIYTDDDTVLQYDQDGIFINEYPSFMTAREIIDEYMPIRIPYHHYCGGYFWVRKRDSYDIDRIINDYNNNTHISKQIEQYDQYGCLLEIYPSASKAAELTKIDVSSIKAAANGKQYSAGGYIWHKNGGKLSFQEQYNNFLLSSSCCEIEEIDDNGDILGVYPSATKAETLFGWSRNAIKRVCDGNAKHTHHRIFRYSNENKRKLLQEKREG